MFDGVFLNNDDHHIVPIQAGAFVILYSIQLSICNSFLSLFVGLLYASVQGITLEVTSAACFGWFLAYVIQHKKFFSLNHSSVDRDENEESDDVKIVKNKNLRIKPPESKHYFSTMIAIPLTVLIFIHKYVPQTGIPIGLVIFYAVFVLIWLFCEEFGCDNSKQLKKYYFSWIFPVTLISVLSFFLNNYPWLPVIITTIISLFLRWK